MSNILQQDSTNSGLQLSEVRTHQRGPYTLQIAPGECVSLRGPSGSGKSLLLRAIADLDEHEGQVSLDGIASHHVLAPKWRKQVALLPAESQWWQDEVGAHFPDGASHWFDLLGFNAESLRWQVSRLSSGEKQRLALARALMNKPRVLLLDEPTASLDADNVSVVEGLVRDYRRDTGAAVLWVSHDEQQAKRVGDRYFQLSAEGIKEAEL